MALEQTLALISDQLGARDPAPETMALLRSVWSKLGADDRESLLDRLGRPASSSDVIASKTDEELRRSLLRQWRWLAGVADSLPPEWAGSYQLLAAEFGAGDPEARRPDVSVRIGSLSPLTEEEIRAMGPENLVDWLSKWDVPDGGWDTPTPRGLADALTPAVASSPDEWSHSLKALLPRLQDPTYIRAVIVGLRDAVKAGESVTWTTLLDALEVVVSEPWEVTPRSQDSFESDQDWKESIRATVSLLQEALDRNVSFDSSALRRVWAILVTALRMRSSVAAVSGPDRLTSAINQLSTTSLQAMFSLCLAVARAGKEMEPWSALLTEAVREELDTDAEESRLASALVASMFPQFVHISGQVAYELIPRLFSSTASAEALDSETFATMLTYARPISDDLLLHIAPYLRTFVASADLGDRDDVREGARWMAIGYLRGLDGFADRDRLIADLGRAEVVSEAAEFLGRVLRDTKEPDPAWVDRSLAFWDAALSNESLETAAFLGFGWWSEADAIDDETWLAKLHPTLERTSGKIDWEEAVVERLARLPDRPDAWRALALIVQGSPDRWEVVYWSRHLTALFERTVDVADKEIRDVRSLLAERLVEREILEFREFVD
jgi:hypothetical protein